MKGETRSEPMALAKAARAVRRKANAVVLGTARVEAIGKGLGQRLGRRGRWAEKQGGGARGDAIQERCRRRVKGPLSRKRFYAAGCKLRCQVLLFCSLNTEDQEHGKNILSAEGLGHCQDKVQGLRGRE